MLLLATNLGIHAFVAFKAIKYLLREYSKDKLIVLMYHRVVPDEVWETFKGPERLFSVPISNFEDQIRALKEANYNFIDPQDIPQAHKGNLKGYNVVISFDDGCKSVYENAFPIMKKHGVKGLVFLTTDPSSSVFSEGEYYEERMKDQEVVELSKAGWSIQSHCISHRPLTELSEDELKREFVESKHFIEELTKRPVNMMAIPLNIYNKKIIRLAQEAGYEFIFSANTGSILPGDKNPLNRFMAEGIMDGQRLLKFLTPTRALRRRIVLEAKRLGPRIFGPKLWMPFREFVFSVIGGDRLAASSLAQYLPLFIIADIGLIIFLSTLPI